MGIDYKKVFERMLKAGKVKNSSEMARILGMTPQAVSNHKKRGELSAGFIMKFAQKCNISVDWLLTGVGDPSAKRVQAEQPTVQGESGTILVAKAEGSADRNGVGAGSLQSGPLCPEEIIYIGKLLKILRSTETKASPALKANIDVIMAALYPEAHFGG
ncbi:MAG: helix-turn-helix domain-containing protein [Proteobacteria bacterium]|nr:helix-turn-helix domain-containing protein [Pseudomonadota bacterium]